MATNSQKFHRFNDAVVMRTKDMSGEGLSPSLGATAHHFAALDDTADIHLAHDSESELMMENEICDDMLYQELFQREKKGRREREKAEIYTKIQRDGERQRTFQESKRRGEGAGKFMQSEYIKAEEARCDSAVSDRVRSGSDHKPASKSHPSVFNMAGKRPLAALTTGRAKNTVPNAPYLYTKDDGKIPAINKVETIVTHAGREEDDLQVPTMDDSDIYAEVGNVLNRMFQVAKQMFAFREYLAAENNSKKPLYHWDRYAAYHKLHLATIELEETTGRLETVDDKIRQSLFSRKYLVPCLNHALNISTSTSKSVAFALNTMSVRSATCMDEIANSSLDEAGRDTARIGITEEIGELLKHSTAAANSVYAAMDLLRTFLHSEIQDDTDQDAIPHEHTKRSSWKYCALLGLSLFSIGLTSFGQFAHLLPADWVPASWIPSNRIWGMQIPEGYAVVYIASPQTSLHDTINDDAEMSMVDKKVTATSLKHLEDAHEATRQQINNIWDALGPPGPDGRYEFGSHTSRPNVDSAQDIQKVREEVKTQLDRVNHEIAHLDKMYEEIVDLRRHVHRVDLRLTKRIDHLPGGRT